MQIVNFWTELFNFNPTITSGIPSGSAQGKLTLPAGLTTLLPATHPNAALKESYWISGVCSMASGGFLEVYQGASSTSQDVVDSFTLSAAGSGSISAAADYSGTVAGTTKLTTSAPHGLTTGQSVTIAGTTDYDGTFTITVVDTTHFYIPVAYTTTKTGTYTQGNGYGTKIGPINVVGKYCSILINNTGAATTAFNCTINRRT